MLVVAVAGAVEADIALQHHVRRAFVGVERPTAVKAAAYVVDQVVVNPGAGLDAEQIDAAHVAEQLLAEVVDVVEADPVFAGDLFGVAPAPAAGDPGVVEVVDVVVFDQVAEGVPDQDSGGAVLKAARMGDFAVGDRDAPGAPPDGVGGGRAGDHDSAAAEVGKAAAPDGDVRGTRTDVEPVPAAVFDHAAGKLRIAHSARHQHRRELHRRLSRVGGVEAVERGLVGTVEGVAPIREPPVAEVVAGAAAGETGAAVAERQVFQPDTGEQARFARFAAAVQRQQRADRRDDRIGAVRLHALRRNPPELPGGAVEPVFARPAERLLHVFKVEPGVFRIGREAGVTAESENVFPRVEALHRQPRFHPFGEQHRFDSGWFAPRRIEITGFHPEAAGRYEKPPLRSRKGFSRSQVAVFRPPAPFLADSIREKLVDRAVGNRLFRHGGAPGGTSVDPVPDPAGEAAAAIQNRAAVRRAAHRQAAAGSGNHQRAVEAVNSGSKFQFQRFADRGGIDGGGDVVGCGQSDQHEISSRLRVYSGISSKLHFLSTYRKISELQAAFPHF